MEIRRATHDDHDGICRVHEGSIRAGCSLHYTPAEIEGWAGSLRPGAHAPSIDRYEFHVAVEEGVVVGFVSLDPAGEEVRALYVHPAAVGRGVGRALLEFAESRALAHDVSRLHLSASLNSVTFYAAAGYAPIEMQRHRVREASLRCVLMTKTLRGPAAPPERRDMPIYLVPYDPSWPGRFAEERALLIASFGASIGDVEHVGSTAVPGLSAKPVLDLLVTIDDIRVAPAFFDPLESLGYQYFPYSERVSPGRRWFCKPDRVHRTHHLHLVQAGNPAHRDHLAFRDALRGDPVLARRYDTLKKDLAARFPDDREAYTEGKGEFIASVLRGLAPNG